MDVLTVALAMTGLATLALGGIHVLLPRLIDIRTAIPPDGPPLRPLPVVGARYATRRRDVHGVIWVSNNAATYALLTLGAADLVAGAWLGTPGGRVLALWAVGWWLVRALSQLSFGRRSGDLMLLVGFLVAAAVHAWAAAV